MLNHNNHFHPQDDNHPRQLPHDHHNQEILEHIAGPILDVRPFRTVSDVFRLLDDPNGLRIFWLLCHVEECVTNIAALVQMTSPAVSHHLRHFKNAGLITSRRDGKEVYYKAAETTTVSLLHEILEDMIEITCPDVDHTSNFSHTAQTSHITEGHHTLSDSGSSDLVKEIRQIHDYLMEHLDKRVTIDQLAKQFLINPTTLKISFKQVYGTSLAAHMKLHRMEKAAELLTQTKDSIRSISRQVGYESQSKFTNAFKQVYGQTPLEYRNNLLILSNKPTCI